jgi:hypothetical protein
MVDFFSEDLSALTVPNVVEDVEDEDEEFVLDFRSSSTFSLINVIIFSCCRYCPFKISSNDMSRNGTFLLISSY